MLSGAWQNRGTFPVCTWEPGKKLLTHYTQPRPKSATSPDHPSAMLVSMRSLETECYSQREACQKNEKKSPFWLLLAGKSPRLNYATKSSLVFEDHFIDCVSSIICIPFQMIDKKNAVAVISLTEWLVKGRRHFGVILDFAGRAHPPDSSRQHPDEVNGNIVPRVLSLA